MNKCDGCGTEFDESVSLYPRLVMSKEVQVARKLAEREEEDMLCLGCWLDSIDSIDKKQLAMLILGMLQKITDLEKRAWARSMFPGSGMVEKKSYPWESQPGPYTSPNSGTVWTGGQYEVGDNPERHLHTTCRDGHASQERVSCLSAAAQKGVASSYLSGMWADKVQ